MLNGKRLCGGILILICLILFASCGQTVLEKSAQENDVIYVSENGKYVPFIATNGYGGIMLIRKDVLPYDLRFNGELGDSSYYENSDIDKWLNGKYLQMIDADVKDTDILITTDDSIGYSGTDVKKISRKVFLPSCAELGFDTSYNVGKEGKTLNCFNGGKNRTAYSGKKPYPWVLRSPNTYEQTGVYAIGDDGKLYTVNSNDEIGIRPVFCIDKNTALTTKEIDGKRVYAVGGTF